MINTLPTSLIHFAMTATDLPSEQYAFQAEINQLLSLIINAFYSNKDIFLRELISNASDAIDKIRYESLTDNSSTGIASTLQISIKADKDQKTLVIEDTGIGMTKEELVKNLGTIAHSGTRAFMEGLKNGSNTDVSLIGQFGVGFYSAFLVADRVHVLSKSFKDGSVHTWESSAGGSFTITEAPRDAMENSGTRITLHLKEDQLKYLEESTIRGIILKHSQFCMFPIRLWVEKEVEQEVEQEAPDATEDTPEKEETTEEPEDGAVEEVEKEPKEVVKETIKVQEYEVVNTQKPIWTRKPEDVTHEEYVKFYKSVYNTVEEPLAYKHVVVDGAVQFKAILYVPKEPPMSIYGRDTEHARNNVKLFVKHVLIMDETNYLLPEYLNFVFGIVDSDDLPLNVSREMLQQNNVLQVIKRNLMKQIIEMMTDLSKKEERAADWEKFYKNYGNSLKTGAHSDAKYRPKLVELLRFQTNKRLNVSLKQYTEEMKPEQKDIYFLAGDSAAALSNSPILIKMRNSDLEVLMLTDTIDEYVMETIKTYEEKKLTNCNRDGMELPKSEEEKKALEDLRKEWEPICEKIKECIPIQKTVYKVRVGEGLGDETSKDNIPCILVSDLYSMTANMERIFKAQAVNGLFSGKTNSRKMMEINPKHPLIKEIKRRVEAGEKIKDIVDIVYNTVCLMSGFTIDNPTEYSNTVFRMMVANLISEEEATAVSDEIDIRDTTLSDQTDDPDPTMLLNEVD